MKRKTQITLKNSNEETKEDIIVELINNKISYLENDKTTVLFDIDKKVIMRENDEMYMEISFHNEKCIVYLKKYNNEMELAIKTKKIDINNNKIMIQYELENEDYLYQIDMED